MALLRGLCALSLATSAALLVDYTSFDPAFCTPGSGCASVRASGFGYLFGGKVPVPVIGLVGYGVLYLLSLASPPLRRRYVPPVAILGGIAALGFFLLQAVVIGELCFYCVVVDVAGMLTAGAAWMWARAARSEPTPSEELLSPAAFGILGAIAVVSPLIWPKLKPQPPVPPQISAYYQSGKINVIEFADFQCPFCRLLHPRLKAIAKEYDGKVNFVQLNMPLERHALALGAARAFVCAKAQGKGPEMADALFDSEDLAPAQNRRAAVSLGLDLDAFDACVVDPKTTDGIMAEAKILRDAGFQGLPTIYVGAVTIVGAQSDEVFREAFDRAARGEGNTGVPGWAFLTVILVACGGVIAWGRPRAPAAVEPGDSAPDSDQRA